MATKRPSDKQLETLAWIATYHDDNGVPPTVREIARAFDIRSSSAQARLGSLLRKGYLRRVRKGARSIVVVDPRERLSKQRPDASVRQAMQPPFRPDDLLHVEAFISHCTKRGVRTDREQLEFYDEEAILLPAVRVEQTPKTAAPLKEPVEIKRPKDFKKTLVPAEDNECPISEWLPEYLESGRAERPSDTVFRAWAPASFMTFVDERGKVSATSRDTEALYYSRYQLISLRAIQPRLTAKLQDRVLFGTDEEWRKLGRAVRNSFAGAKEKARETVSDSYRYLLVLTAIHEILDQRARVAARDCNENLKKGCTRREAFRDAVASFDDPLDREEKVSIQNALSAANLSCEDLDNFRVRLYLDSRSSGPRHEVPCLQEVRNQILDNTPYSYRFLRDCDELAGQLTWVLTRLKYPQRSLREFGLGYGEQQVCPYCEEAFKPRSNRQRTCGSKGCKKDHRDLTKRIKRSRGLYDS